MLINIKNMNKAEVLARLYNSAKPQGMGFLHYEPSEMTVHDAESIIKNGGTLRFDYLKGRVMKVNIAGDEFSPKLYDRDNGVGAAARALSQCSQ